MRIVVATRSMGDVGGAESYVLTAAEHLSVLGHEVTIGARKVGVAAELARERGLEVSASTQELPSETDGVLVLDRALSLELSERYPEATRVFVVHNIDDPYLPPPLPGVVAASIAPNDRFAAIARGCVGAGEVVRMTQPIDLRRFSPRKAAADRPANVLLFGNYHSTLGQRVTQLREAWAQAELEWRPVGGASATTEVAEVIASADIVVGYGRAILEAMACGRPAYVHEHSGSAGWVTAGSYPRMEADGFSGIGVRPPPDLDELRSDLGEYSPELGRVGQDLVRTHHDARTHAAELVALLGRLQPVPVSHDSSELRALRNLSEAQLRAESAADHYRRQLQAANSQLEDAKVEARQAKLSLQELTRTRRYRLAGLLARPLDRWRWFRDRPRGS